MRRAWAFCAAVLLALAGWGVPLWAQEEGDGEAPVESDWNMYAPELYSRGDQTFLISLGVVVPAIFLNQGEIIDHNISPQVGGTGSLTYNYFLDSRFSIGGEAGGLFASTVGQNVLYIIPIGFRLGYQLVFNRFEFPFTVTVGIAPQKYLDKDYLGFFAKAGGAFFYRFHPDWSFGVNANWCWFPQWVEDSTQNVDGNFVDITISARYHF
jgi:hypothetical protein